MWMLGIETSGPTASAGLMEDGVLRAEYALMHTRTHSETILPLVERLMEDLSLAPESLSAIAVDIGPGSFTGVRIGVCTANAMALALGIPVIGVPSLRVLYEGVCVSDRPIAVLLDARNENLYSALYAPDGAELQPPAATDLTHWLPSLPENVLFVGDGVLAYREAIQAAFPKAALAPERFAHVRAGALLAAAWQLYLEKGRDGFPEEAAPLYLRPSQAERMRAMREEA